MKNVESRIKNAFLHEEIDNSLNPINDESFFFILLRCYYLLESTNRSIFPQTRAMCFWFS